MKNKALSGDFDRLQKRLRDKQDLNGVKSVVYETSKLIKSRTVQNAPVDTGRLRGSIHRRTDSKNLTGLVGVTAPYAKHVENGTSRQDAQPFLKPAVNQYKDYFINEIRKEAYK